MSQIAHNKMIPDVITIDGPAASGKSTIGTRLAQRLNYLCLDTGVMYRAVTLQVLRDCIDPLDEEAVTRVAQAVVIDVKPASVDDGRMMDILLNDEDVTWEIRSEPVNRFVSEVSVYAGVRQAMTQQQRRIGQQGKIIMLGRDIGTVVMPDADLKIYLDASVEERAARRLKEELEQGKNSTYADVLANVRHRDQIDSGRAIAPLSQAADAVLVNTDGMSIDEVVCTILSLIFDKNPVD